MYACDTRAVWGSTVLTHARVSQLGRITGAGEQRRKDPVTVRAGHIIGLDPDDKAGVPCHPICPTNNTHGCANTVTGEFSGTTEDTAA